MFARLMFAAAALAVLPAAAQAQAQEDGDLPKRVRSILLYGEEQCPRSEDPDEIVVCATVSESPFRIPKRFREQPAESPAARSWTDRVEMVEEVNRRGLPHSCSEIGTGGQTGCTREMVRRWYQERARERARIAREQAPEE